MSSKRVAVRRARLLIGCIAVLCFARSASSQYQFNSWSTEEGLPQNSIQAILQSRDGYLWLTTSDGLVRFDGVRFTVFERGSTAGLNSNRLTALFEDREGSLWIGTEDRGAIRYQHGTFTSYVAGEASLPSPAISFMENREGNLLVNTGNGVFERRGEKFVPYPVEHDFPRASGVASVGSAQYRAFSFYDRNGVHRYEDGRYKTYPMQDDTAGNRPKFVYQDQRGTLWISTLNKGLFKLRPDSSSVEEVKVTGGLSDYVVAVFEENDQVVWLSTYATGLVRVENGLPTTFGEAEGYSANRATRVFTDREGNTWLGTHNTGLYQLSKRTVSAYTVAEGLSRDIVYTTYQDHEGTIWIGTWGAGLSSLKDGKFTNYTDIRKSTGAFVTALFEDSENALWVGSNNNGVNRLKDGNWTTFRRKDGLSNDSIYAILQDRAGALWIGTNGGLNRFQDGVFKSFSTEDGLAHKRIQVIYEDRAGTLWLGTLGGVSRLRDGVFTSITEKDGLSSNHVRSIYEDGEGVIWIGTYDGGLNRFKDGKITRYTTQDGLYNNGVFWILEDSRGFFWMSCNRGVYRVSKQALNDFAEGKIHTIASISFDKSDGMPSSECNGGYQPAGLKTRDGKLLFPTQGGLAVFDAESVTSSNHPPPVVIEDLLLDHKSTTVGQRLEISPGQENLEIQYTGLSFIKPNLIRFRYKMDGLDNDWIEAGTRRAAYYSHLPPGNYTFTVIAANSDGVWNDSGASLKIIVHPPFWRTWWFLSLVSLLFIGMAVVAYRYRVLRLKKAHAAQEAFSRQLIESQERERKRIAAELHDSLGQSLAIIKNRAALSLSRPAEHEIAIEQLDEISTAATYAIDEVREIAYNLRPYQLDRLGLTKALEAMLKKVAASDGLRLTFEIDQIDDVFASESEINLYRIMQESLGNVLKHSEATQANVSIKRSEEEIEITVRDNGKGFDPEFPAQREAGKGGFGLIGISERARMLGGRYSILSAPGEGTTVTVKLDLRERRQWPTKSQ